jgi:hypothetical protein
VRGNPFCLLLLLLPVVVSRDAFADDFGVAFSRHGWSPVQMEDSRDSRGLPLARSCCWIVSQADTLATGPSGLVRSPAR